MENNTKKDGKKKSRLNILLFCCCVIGILILVSNVTLVILPIINKSISINYSQTFLSEALSVLGLIVTIWAGLNIYNVVERKDVNNIKELADNLSSDLEQCKGDLYELSKESDGLFDSIVFQFRNELLRKKNDPLSLYFYKCFSKKQINKSPDKYIIFELLIIEQLFSIVLELHNTSQMEISELKESVNHATKNIDYVKSQSDDSDIQLYLRVRKAQFIFYKGYAFTKWEDIYKVFSEAAEEFIELKGYHKDVFILEYNETTPEKIDYDKYQDLVKNSRYISHYIGEAYSRIVLNYCNYIRNNPQKHCCDTDQKMLNIIRKAIFYCSKSVDWLNNDELFEMYHRNLGCAYERMDRLSAINENVAFSGNNNKKIIKAYKTSFYQALNCNDTPKESYFKIYKVLLSYLYKYLDHYLFLQNNMFVCFSEISAIDDIKKLTVNQSALEYLIDLLDISSFAIEHNTQFSLPIVMNGFGFVFVTAITMVERTPYNFSLSIKDCLNIIEKRINLLKLINNNDTYFKLLIKQLNILRRTEE